LHDDLDPKVMPFAYTESHEAFSGALALLKASWVNPPHLDERAHHKPLQLATAIRAGLTVPRTLITNDPDEARRFIDDVGPARTIYKTFLATEEHWRETRVLRNEELQMIDAVRFAPVIFQEYIAADADIRVTIVGDELFAAAIRSAPNGYSVDYRMDMEGATFTPAKLPDHVVKMLHIFMQTLGIVYGAVDLLYTTDGDYIFLEVNPAGEWRFVEERTAQPITSAMADLLVRLDHH
jgi:glutathione synthase/RimK-type ligase-like ATP-grasp enzyme